MTTETGSPGPSRAVRSIATIGDSVLRRAKQAHYARAICGALGTFTLVIACAVNRGSRLVDSEVLALAALLALATFVAWVRSERIESRDVLRRIDQRLHLSGAFLSAHESCAHSPSSPVAQLGAAKLLQRVRPNQAMEAAVSHTLGFVVLPLLGTLALVQSVQARDARQSRAGRVTVEVGTVADHLADIERMNRASLSEMQRQELARIQAAAEAAAQDAADQSLQNEPASGASREEGEERWQEQVRSIADDIDRLAAEAQPGSELAEQLAEAAAQAEALAMESAPPSQAPGEPTPESDRQPASPLASEAGDDPASGSEEGSGGGGSTSDPASAEGPTALEGDAGEPIGMGQVSEPPPAAPKTSGESTPRGTAPQPEDVPGATASGALAPNGSPPAAGGGERGKIGVLQPADDQGSSLAVGQSDAPGSGEVPEDESEKAVELLRRPQWWSDRDDAILRAWLAKRAPK